MRFVIKTTINKNYLEILKQFDRKLFLALAPPFPKLNLLKFDGSTKGDIIHIQFKPSNIEWISKITDDWSNDTEAAFIDEGIQLPPGLKYWKHIHRIKKVSESISIIEDDISFKGSFRLLTFVLYPILWLSFYPRKRAYSKYFK